jgi:hypothetical protein
MRTIDHLHERHLEFRQRSMRQRLFVGDAAEAPEVAVVFRDPDEQPVFRRFEDLRHRLGDVDDDAPQCVPGMTFEQIDVGNQHVLSLHLEV